MTSTIKATIFVVVFLSIIALFSHAAPTESNQSSKKDQVTDFFKDQPHLLTKPGELPAKSNDDKQDFVNPSIVSFQDMFNRLPTSIQEQLLRIPGFAQGMQMAVVMSQFNQISSIINPSTWATWLNNFRLPSREGSTTTHAPITATY